MNIIEIDSGLERQFVDAYSAWVRELAGRNAIITIPPKGAGSTPNTVSFYKVPTQFLDVLGNNGVPFIKSST
jgi:hypothetical protein